MPKTSIRTAARVTVADVSTLYYGDNLAVLREYIKSESVDLVYLDPPFNSARGYNVLFAEHDAESEAQIQAFEDTWRWDDAAEKTYRALTGDDAESRGVPTHLVALIEALRGVWSRPTRRSSRIRSLQRPMERNIRPTS